MLALPAASSARSPWVAPALFAALVLGGCGTIRDHASRPHGLYNPPGQAIRCLRHHGYQPQRVSVRDVRVAADPGAPVITFLNSTAEAEADELSGRAEPAERIGSSLLFVKGAADRELSVIERCLGG